MRRFLSLRTLAIAIFIVAGLIVGAGVIAQVRTDGRITKAGGGMDHSSDAGTARDSTYLTLTDFRDAFIAAGGSCPSWSEIADPTFAAAIGHCDNSTTLSIFSNESSKTEQAVTLTATIGSTLLVGPNWILNADNADINQVRAELGGDVISGSDE